MTMTTTTPDVKNFADSLSMLRKFTTFVLKRKDNGMEEGLVFLQLKNKENTVSLDEFVLKRPNEGTDNGSVNQNAQVAAVPQFTKIKEVNNNHEVSPSMSTPHLMLPVNLPPTLSITYNPIPVE